MNIILPRLIAVFAMIAALGAMHQAEQFDTSRYSEIYFAVAIFISATILSFT